MHLPGPFEIVRLVEFEGPFREPTFLLPDAHTDALLETRASRDPRVYNRDTNKFFMSFHSLIIKTGRANILVDTCVGNCKHRPALDNWHMRDGPYLADMVKVAGFGPEQIDFVLCTHLHADHVGWNTQLEDGRWVPTFPNARYLFAEKEVAHWQSLFDAEPDHMGITSWQDSVLPVLEAGLVDQVACDHEIETGIHLAPAPGHTPGNVVLSLNDGKEQAYMIGDTIHHAVQVERPHWSSNFCSDPIQSAATRRAFLEDVADSGAWVMPAHFPTPTAVRIESAPDTFQYKFVGD